MGLHNMVCDKPRPVYKCIESVEGSRNTLCYLTNKTETILGTFHLSWEYQIDYVESRVPQHLIDKHFKLLS
jgi:hypothetical protein